MRFDSTALMEPVMMIPNPHTPTVELSNAVNKNKEGVTIKASKEVEKYKALEKGKDVMVTPLSQKSVLITSPLLRIQERKRPFSPRGHQRQGAKEAHHNLVDRIMHDLQKSSKENMESQNRRGPVIKSTLTRK